MFSGSAPQVIRGRKTGVPFPSNLKDDANGMVSPTAFHVAMDATRAQRDKDFRGGQSRKTNQYGRDEFWNDEAESFLHQVNRSSISPLSLAPQGNEDEKDDDESFLENSFFFSAPRPSRTPTAAPVGLRLAASPTPHALVPEAGVALASETPLKRTLVEKSVQTPSRDDWDGDPENTSRPSSLYNRLLAAGSSSEDDVDPLAPGLSKRRQSKRRKNADVQQRAASLSNRSSLDARHASIFEPRRQSSLSIKTSIDSIDFSPDSLAHDDGDFVAPSFDPFQDEEKEEKTSADSLKFISRSRQSRNINSDVVNELENLKISQKPPADLPPVSQENRNIPERRQSSLQSGHRDVPDEMALARRISVRGDIPPIKMDFESSEQPRPVIFTRREVTIIPVLSSGERMPSSVGHGTVHIRQNKESNRRTRTPRRSVVASNPIDDELLAPIQTSATFVRRMKEHENSESIQRTTSLLSPTRSPLTKVKQVILPEKIIDTSDSTFDAFRNTPPRLRSTTYPVWNNPSPIRDLPDEEIAWKAPTPPPPTPPLPPSSSPPPPSRHSVHSERRQSLFPPQFGQAVVLIDDYDFGQNENANEPAADKETPPPSRPRTTVYDDDRPEKTKMPVKSIAMPPNQNKRNRAVTYQRYLQNKRQKLSVLSATAKLPQTPVVCAAAAASAATAAAEAEAGDKIPRRRGRPPQNSVSLLVPLSTPLKKPGRQTPMRETLTRTPGVIEIVPVRENDSDGNEQGPRVRTRPIEFWRGESISYRLRKIGHGVVGNCVSKITRVEYSPERKRPAGRRGRPRKNAPQQMQQLANSRIKQRLLSSDSENEIENDHDMDYEREYMFSGGGGGQGANEYRGPRVTLFSGATATTLSLESDSMIKVFGGETDGGSSPQLGDFKAFFTAGMADLRNVGQLDYRFQSMLEYRGICKGGVIELPPLVVKPNRSSGETCFMFVVQSGEIETTIHTTSKRMERGELFCVPPGNQYSIKNISTGVSRVYFFAVTVPESSS